MVFWSPRGRPTSPPLVSTYLSSLLSTLPSPCLTRPLSASGEAVKRPRCANDLHRAPICSAPIDAGIAGPAANRQPLAAGTPRRAAESPHSPSNRRAPGAPSTAIDGPINRCRPPQPTPPSLTRGSPPALRLGIPLPRKAPRNAADRRGNAHFWVVRVTIRSRRGPQLKVPRLDAGIAGHAAGRQPPAAGTSRRAAEPTHSLSNRRAPGAPSTAIDGPISGCRTPQPTTPCLTRGSPPALRLGIPLPRKAPRNAADRRGNAHFWVVRVTIRSRRGPQLKVPRLDAGIAGPAAGRQPLAAGTSRSAAESPHSTSNRQALGAPSVVIGGPIERCSALQTHLTRLTRGSPSPPRAGIPLPRKTPRNAAESREWCSP